jgi:RNA polymerase sigma-70 factor (ECF subfamily)
MAEMSSIIATEEHFNALIKEHGGILRATIIRLCPRDLGLQFDDIEQEARLRLWRGIASEREIRDPASYIYRIAVTVTIDAIRRSKTRREEQLEDDDNQEQFNRVHHATSASDSPDRVAERQQIIGRVEAVLAGFSEDRRRAVALYLQGLNTTEIGDTLLWSEPKARNLLYRGLKELRRQLRAEGIDYEIE